MKTIRIGSGAGYSGDRIEPAIELAESGDIDYLGFECLAERTIGLAQQARLADPEAGYDPLLEARFRALLPICHGKGVRVITNMGAANPAAAARRTRALASELGLRGLKVAHVAGDDVLETVAGSDLSMLETGTAVATLGDRIVSANAYLGAGVIVDALAAGADVVITGRVADPALFVAPLIHEFGWPMDDWTRMGQATVVGHLLECAGQITGGYFADPGYKDVDAMARLGFPIAEVGADGAIEITKVACSGGRISVASCTEQLLYEIHDPARYLTPDVTADFSNVRLKEAAPDRVAVSGADGRARPDTLKVSIGYRDGFVGEGQISYGGPGAIERATLAAETVTKRLTLCDVSYDELRTDLIGVDSLFPQTVHAAPGEVRLRIAARTIERDAAVRVANEVESLYTNGPAGGGGAMKTVREILGVASVFVDRATVRPRFEVQEVA